MKLKCKDLIERENELETRNKELNYMNNQLS